MHRRHSLHFLRQIPVSSVLLGVSVFVGSGVLAEGYDGVSLPQQSNRLRLNIVTSRNTVSLGDAF